MSYTPSYKAARLYGLPVSIAAFGAVLSFLGCALGIIYVVTFGIAVLFLGLPFLYRTVRRCAYHIVERDGTAVSRELASYLPEELDFVVEQIGLRRREALRISLDCLVSVTSDKEKSPHGGAKYVYSLDRRLAVRLVFDDGGETVTAVCDIAGSPEMTGYLIGIVRGTDGGDDEDRCPR